MVANDRRSFYQAQLSLRRLLSAFVAESVAPGLKDGARLLDDAMALTENGAYNDHFKARLHSLVAWHDQASEILPMLAVLASRSSDH
jgi:hypothetical protein